MKNAAAPVVHVPVVRCLADVFASLPDPRNPKGLRHPLGALYSLIVVAMLCGEQNPEHISRFARHHPKLLPALGFRPPKQGRLAERRGVIAPPSNDMIARALAAVDGAVLNQYIGRWCARVLGESAAVSVDGKCLRGQGDYVLSLYCPEIGRVLWQERVGKKENELSALLRSLPALLERLGGVRVFTGDAGFCHKEVARVLAENHRDYLLQLKAPHTTDLALAGQAFEQLTRRPREAWSVEKRGAGGAAKS